MTQPHDLVVLVTLLSVLVYFWTGIRVAGARRKFGVVAPATTGNEDFERYFRVQMNTLEWIPMFLASLWLFSLYWPQTVAAGIGALWPIGRIIYALSYVKDPKSRGAGFGIQALATIALWIGAAIGAVLALLASAGV